MKILLFGASGTAGGAVLQACLDTPVVKEVRVIVRRPLGWTEAKLWELVQTNYLDYAAVTEAFRAVDAGLTTTDLLPECAFSGLTPQFYGAASRDEPGSKTRR